MEKANEPSKRSFTKQNRENRRHADRRGEKKKKNLTEEKKKEQR